jgi:hypothetical protein
MGGLVGWAIMGGWAEDGMVGGGVSIMTKSVVEDRLVLVIAPADVFGAMIVALRLITCRY